MTGWFLRNLPHWIRYDLLASDSPPLWQRLRRKLAAAYRRREGGEQTASSQQAAKAMDGMFGKDALPESLRAVMTSQLAAFFAYRPQKWDGEVLLLFARCRPLTHSLLPDLGWSTFAARHRRVVVACNHDNILQPTHVRAVAAALDEALNRAGSAGPSGETPRCPERPASRRSNPSR